MKQIYFIKFSFGTNVPKNIPREQLEYFASFFSSFFKADYTLNETISESVKTIPVSYRRISSNSDILAKKVIEALTLYSVIDQKKHIIKDNDDLIVIDVKSNMRDTTYLYLASEIDAILKTDKQNSSPRFVILLENIPATIQNFSAIASYIKKGKILLIDKKKRFKYKNSPIKVNKQFSFDSLTKSPFEKAKFKLIRKIGHYGRFRDGEKNDLVACNEFFYDGRDCTSEISDILFEKIVDLKENKSFNTTKIIFDCPESPWLKTSILYLDSDLRNLKSDYELAYSEYKNITDVVDIDNTSESILFVFDLIHTGDVFRSKYKYLKELYPNSKIRSVAILVSDTEQQYIKITDNTAIIQISEDERVEVDFFQSVVQVRHPSFGRCPMCHELHMEVIKDSSYINEEELTSFEAWTMFDEAGYHPEDFPTDRENPYPSAIPLKPNSLKLLQHNSAYLALKYERNIERNELLGSSDLILVFPDETTNEREIKKRDDAIQLEETASGYFAETLLQLKDIEYFGIPRNILDRVKLTNESKPDLSFIETDYPEFYSKLRLLSDEIIVMDELGFSGGTLVKIIAILDIAKKKPKAYFPLFNFNPDFLNSEKKKDYEVLSLYDFKIN